MAWGDPVSYPRAILHVDGDAFFASCEVAKNPALRGKVVITGRERGIVSAASYEAKALGIKRGVPLRDVKKICPEAIILPSDYETYSIFSQRMYAIVRRYTPAVEEYGIDECFADLTGLRRVLHMSYPDIAAAIKRDLQRELNMTFSLGLSATKVLAKLGSKWKKPDGLTYIPLRDKEQFLAKTACVAVWGIGHNTAAYLEKHNVRTALQFAHKSEEWIRKTVSKPYFELWRELNGEVVLELDVEGRESYSSISKTKTFTPPSRDPHFIFSQLSKNIENACIKARRWDLASSKMSFFLKTQEFRYQGGEIKLPHSTNVPHDILKAVTEHFPKIFSAGGGSASGGRPPLYRATGITLHDLKPADPTQLDLFGGVRATESLQTIFKSVDHLSERYGKHAVFLGSSFEAMTHAGHAGERGDLPARVLNLLPGETARRRLPIPVVGEVS